MNKNKHLTLSNRIDIEKMLNEKASFKAIGRYIGKDCTTVSKEVRNHIQYKKTGCFGGAYNACKNRYNCSIRKLCKDCIRPKAGKCKNCKICNFNCEYFEKEECSRLLKPPYVCNGCPSKSTCTLEKHVYEAKYSQDEYEQVFSESHEGITYSEDEIHILDNIVSPLIKQGQSLNHISHNNADEIMVSKSTLYRLVDMNLLTARNIDLPKKVNYCKRKKKSIYKVDKKCRVNRTYDDFINYIQENIFDVVEIDTVIGTVGGKCLLTVYFRKSSLMLAFLRESNDSKSVIDVFNYLYDLLGDKNFKKLFKVILTDNGSEFTNPLAIEYDSEGNPRTKIFYCDPNAPYQKGAIEHNHTLIRRIIKKGESFDNYVQDDIDLMMNHINSYLRGKLNNKTPFDYFEYQYGKRITKKLGIKKIEANNVILTKELLKK